MNHHSIRSGSRRRGFAVLALHRLEDRDAPGSLLETSTLSFLPFLGESRLSTAGFATSVLANETSDSTGRKLAGLESWLPRSQLRPELAGQSSRTTAAPIAPASRLDNSLGAREQSSVPTPVFTMQGTAAAASPVSITIGSPGGAWRSVGIAAATSGVATVSSPSPSRGVPGQHHAAGAQRTAAAKGAPAATAEPPAPATAATFGRMPLSFEANQGQTDAGVQFLSRGAGHTLFLTPTGAVLTLEKSVGDAANSRAVRGDAIFVQMVGANPDAQAVGQGELAGKVNDFTGGHAHTVIPTFSRVEYQNIYSGISLTYYGQGQALEYDFTVAPGADPSAIRMNIQGVDSLSLNSSGGLVLHTAVGDVVEHAPVLYQQIGGARHAVAGKFVVEGSQVGFQVGNYDHSRPLVIDPVLSYSTFLGDNGYSAVNGIAVDSAGSAYVTGWAGTSTFPTTPGAYMTTPDAGTGGFITKLNPQGSGLVYSTFIDGQPQAIAIDSSGNAYITGYAGGLATTPGAFVSGGWGYDAYVTKLNALGNGVVYTARIGGDFNDFGNSIAVDAAGDAFITGTSYNYAPTNNFPILNAVQPNWGGNYDDGFVTELNPSGSALVFSTFLGGNSIDEGTGIAVDPSGNAYATGFTGSADFFTTPGAWNRTTLFIDSWVTKFTHSGAVSYSTLLGGGNAFSAGIDVDASGDAFITGDSHGSFIPTTPGAFNTIGGSGFITKFNPTGSGLVYSTYLIDGLPTAIAIDGNGNAAVTGEIGTTVGQYAMVPFNAIQQANAGGADAFIVEINAAGAAPLLASYLGGAGQDKGLAIATDAAGSLYVGGTTTSSDFPTTPSSFQPNFLGMDNAQNEGFATKIAGITSSSSALSSLTLNPTSVTGGSSSTGTVKLTAPAPAGGAVVTLTSGQPLFAAVPASVTVAAGTTTASFAIATHSAWSGSVAPTITATYGGIARSANLQINPAANDVVVSSLTFSPTSVIGGKIATGTVTLSGKALAGGATVALSSGDPSIVGVPATVFIPQGAVSATFAVATAAVSASTAVSVSATYGWDTTVFSSLTVNPATVGLSGLTLNPTSVTGGNSSTGTVTLSGAAPAGGYVVTLASSNSAVASTPAAVTVPAGATSATFTVSTVNVSANTAVTISATAGGVTKSATLSVLFAQSDSVSIPRAEYRTSQKQLRVSATSTSNSAVLKVYVTATGELIGTLTNNGGGKYSGQFTWPSNPQNITVRSSLGGSASKTVKTR